MTAGKSISILAAALILASPMLASAQEHECTAKKAPARMALDNDVKVEVQKLELEYKLATIDLHSKKMELEKKMMAELMKEDPGRKEMEGIFDDMMKVKKDMHEKKIEHLLAVKEIMPPEHWKAYLMKRHHDSKQGCGHGRDCCAMKKGCSKIGKGAAAPCGVKKSAGCEKDHEGCESATPCVKIGK